jgi:hypothetical protein
MVASKEAVASCLPSGETEKPMTMPSWLPVSMRRMGLLGSAAASAPPCPDKTKAHMRPIDAERE